MSVKAGDYVSKYKKSAETKQKILDGTISLIVEQGYSSLNIKDIADRLEMPRSLIYYYYKNRDDIMSDIYCSTYQKLSSIADRLLQDRDDPILYLIVKYILHYRFVVQNPVLCDFFFSRPAYVYQGREVLRTAVDTCFSASSEAFRRLRPDAGENELYAFIIACDSLMHALLEGLYNGVLSMDLRGVILYFGQCTIMVNFSISREEMAHIVDTAFELTEPIKTLDDGSAI